ncbi:MAG: hypothetical protein GY810_21145 [Aureispira sp.]|nr:hypothetical protein [Aureispira sp.]
MVCQLEKEELKKSKAFYQWKHRIEGLPHFSAFEGIAEVPIWDQYELRNRLFANTKMMDGFRSAQNEKKAHPKRFSDYRSLVESRIGKATIPAYVFRNWQSDDFFAEQLLSGCNAGLIEKCQHIEEELHKNGYDLSEALAKGELYQVNYEILADLSPDIPSPFILLQSDPDDGILIPLAIQLAPSDPVFTPDDAPNDWLLAKMWCRMVDCNIAQMCIHLLFSHMLMDNFNLALHRNFSPSHPIYQLLIPHFKNVIAGNIVAKDVLIGDNGMFNRITKLKDVYLDLGRKAWKTWSVKQKLILPYDLEQRGMDDREALGHYPYRDDGMLIWNAIRNYVKAVVDSYYKEDQQVQQDNELQAWIYETVHQGLKTSDLEDTIQNKKDLIDLLSGVIFNSSAIHSSLNSEMFKTMGFIPNSPLVLRGAYPKEKGKTSLNDLMQALPDMETSELIIDMMAILGHRDLEGFIAKDEDVLGEETLLSTHPKVRMAHARFKDELEAAALSIEKINKERKYPYAAFLPEQITSSASW